MPKHRLAAAEVAAVQARFAAGESVAAVAASLGRSRQSLARIKGAMDRHQARRLDTKLNIRVTEGERAAFQTVAEAHGLTVSEAIRHLVKQASSLLALQADELAAISAARRELAAVGNNLNQLARLGASGRLGWKSGDAALLRRVRTQVDEVSEAIVLLLATHDSHQTLPADQAVASLARSASMPKVSP
jgi:antitoxin component of RelBE/YafQ-DinJ toxin-antitoxin module